jgi:hypothetical protein
MLSAKRTGQAIDQRMAINEIGYVRFNSDVSLGRVDRTEFEVLRNVEQSANSWTEKIVETSFIFDSQ